MSHKEKELEIEEEVFIEEDEAEEVRKPSFDPKDINITVEPKALFTILSRIRSGGIDLNTEFQRSGDLWNTYYQSRLIESILLRFPLPAFYFDASDDDKWLVVDGLQRLWALKRFIVDENLKLRGLEVLEDMNGARYQDLPEKMKLRINEFQVITFLIKPGTPKEVKYDVFNRINTGGLTLTSQEIRHALNQKIAAPFLKKLVYKDKEGKEFTEQYERFIGVNDKRMAGRELILRHLAFRRVGWRNYKPPLRRFLDDEMEILERGITEELMMKIEELWNALNVANHIFEEHTFSKSLATDSNRQRLNSSIFEVWSVLIAELNDDQKRSLLNNEDKVVSDFKELLLDNEFNKSISSSTSSKSNVTTRFEKVENLIKKYT
ncbi:DUF262 domain-containing protein [Phaeodactylibacter xiamenensis]|uniref:DUF262 domain-containing protein n=1 Tax=Phaeodactylibacter xiamenensis TaxID=1524460 RepID=UPI0024A8645C|nr:DUF262 domain-containing protein [Phaeodactylibacter xiamenensis]